MEQTRGQIQNISESLGFMVPAGNGLTFTPLTNLYQKYVDAACMDVVTGSFDYNTVIKRTVKELSNSGIRAVDYASGHINRAPVAVRRAILTGVNQVSAKINEKVASDLGTDYFEVTAHAGARPSHADWQGKVYKHSELVSVCGLGDVAGLCGANCRHAYYSFFPDISVRAYSDADLKRIRDQDAKKETWLGKEYNGYERTQKARQYESTMRKQRSYIQALKDGGADPADIQAAQARYLNTMHEYKGFCAKMDMRPDMQRVYIDGLGRMSGGRIATISERGITNKRNASNTAVKIDLKYLNSEEYKNKFRGITGDTKVDNSIYKYAKAALIHRNGSNQEDLYILSAKSGEVLAKNITSTEKQGVKANKNIIKAIKENPGQTIGLHTHPDGTPPTGSDIQASYARNYKIGVVACSDGNVYIYKGNGITQRYIDSKIDRKINELAVNEKSIYNNRIKVHEIELKELSKKEGFLYEKK